MLWLLQLWTFSIFLQYNLLRNLTFFNIERPMLLRFYYLIKDIIKVHTDWFHYSCFSALSTHTKPTPVISSHGPALFMTSHILPSHNSIRMIQPTCHSQPVTQSHPYLFSSLADKRQWLHSVTFIPPLDGREMDGEERGGEKSGCLPLDRISPPTISPLCRFPLQLLRACWHLKCGSLVQQWRKVREPHIKMVPLLRRGCFCLHSLFLQHSSEWKENEVIRNYLYIFIKM